MRNFPVYFCCRVWWLNGACMGAEAHMSRIPKVVLLIESSRASGRALLGGIAEYSHHHGPWSFLWEPAGLEKAQPLLEAGDADGIILRDVENLEQILAYNLPAVVVGHRQREIPGMVNVVTDSQAIGRMGAEHLIGCGFKHFAFCGYLRTPLENTTWSETRLKHFAERIHESGFGYPPHYELGTTTVNWSKEIRSLAQWLVSLPKPLGLMACNDDCSQRVMEACKLAGLTVPDMVGVVGADNDEVICGLTDPPLSSIAINFQRAGYEAAHTLNCLMQRSRAVPQRINVMASHVVARRSTDFVCAEEAHLAKALRFIRDQARPGVSVNEVSLASGLSRRALEKRFRTLLGRSILEEIRRVRTDQMARLLVETELPVSQIAEGLGFADVQHFARYFSASKNLTPLAYRRSYSGKHAPQSRSQNGDCFPQSGVEAPGVLKYQPGHQHNIINYESEQASVSIPEFNHAKK
jgi:LacI family transcriptional regulator